MKTKITLLLAAATLVFSACGSTARYADLGSEYQDGIYYRKTEDNSKAKPTNSDEELKQLIARTNESERHYENAQKHCIAGNTPSEIDAGSRQGTNIKLYDVNRVDIYCGSSPTRYSLWTTDSPYCNGCYPYGYEGRLYGSVGIDMGPLHMGLGWGNPWHCRRFDPWSWYGGWYDPWYIPYRYGWHRWYGPGWYDPWYYGWGGWYGPWYGPGWYYRRGHSGTREYLGNGVSWGSRSGANRSSVRTGMGSQTSHIGRSRRNSGFGSTLTRSSRRNRVSRTITAGPRNGGSRTTARTANRSYRVRDTGRNIDRNNTNGSANRNYGVGAFRRSGRSRGATTNGNRNYRTSRGGSSRSTVRRFVTTNSGNRNKNAATTQNSPARNKGTSTRRSTITRNNGSYGTGTSRSRSAERSNISRSGTGRRR